MGGGFIRLLFLKLVFMNHSFAHLKEFVLSLASNVIALLMVKGISLEMLLYILHVGEVSEFCDRIR
jgi:hypothetical protein